MQYPKGLKKDYTNYEEIAKDKFSIVRKYFNPNLKFCGMTLTQHTYKRKFYTGQGGTMGLDATLYDNNHHELCKKTKSFLGIVFLSSVVGAGYYFNWFRKK